LFNQTKGVFRGEAPELTFAYFCSGAKVGRPQAKAFFCGHKKGTRVGTWIPPLTPWAKQARPLAETPQPVIFQPTKAM